MFAALREYIIVSKVRKETHEAFYQERLRSIKMQMFKVWFNKVRMTSRCRKLEVISEKS